MSDRFKNINRREFFSKGSKLAFCVCGGMALSAVPEKTQAGTRRVFSDQSMQFGLVTYLWGKDWELPELLRNCDRAGVYGVELRVDHAHGVSPELSARERQEVRLRFQNSPVELVGFGTNYEFHSPDKDKLKANLNGAKEYVRLSHNLGGGGVKVKPNTLPEGVPEEKTIEQIGNALNDLGEYAGSFGQKIRVEVHGPKTSQLPVMAAIFEHVNQPSVGVCWNCNDADLEGKGLRHNFNLVKDDLADIVHIRELGIGNYPYQKLFDLLADVDYQGWILLEARTNPGDRIKALHQQKQLFEEMMDKAG